MRNQLNAPEWNVLLVNVQDNLVAKIEDSTFTDSWNWIETSPGWTPADDIPVEPDHVDGVVIFSPFYEERLIRELCNAIHDKLHHARVSILVEISQSQTPSADRERKFDEGIFVYSPLREESLLKRFELSR